MSVLGLRIEQLSFLLDLAPTGSTSGNKEVLALLPRADRTKS